MTTRPPLTFLVLGAQRCGTTWIYRALKSHPHVFLPARKELEHFSYNKNVSAGLTGYLEHFRGSEEFAAVGEVSPGYLWADPDTFPSGHSRGGGRNPDIPGTVARELGPGLRLVVSLRDPVERAISAYVHHLTLGRFPPTVRILDAPREHGILELGFYCRQLRPWLRVFPASSFHVGVFEETTLGPEPYFEQLYHFLGVDPRHKSAAQSKVANRGARRASVSGGLSLGMIASVRMRTRPRAAPLVTSEEIAALGRMYRQDTTELEALFPVNLRTWRSHPSSSAADRGPTGES